MSMNKDKKEELKKLFSIIDEKKFLRFASRMLARMMHLPMLSLSIFCLRTNLLTIRQSLPNALSTRRRVGHRHGNSTMIGR